MAEPGSNLKKDLTAEEFWRFRDWIHQHSGIYLEDTRTDALRISLVARATRLGFDEYSEYFELLEADEAEFRELMNLVTINETSFFRFPAQFDALRDLVIPEILETKSRGSHAFRVWSAGCSTGEEPYTVAMTLLDSSLDAESYRRAAVAGGHRPIEPVRRLVDFSYHNLVKEPYPLSLLGNWDVIFCRNVTIYFRMESTRRVIDNLFESLNPGGYLFVGHSETLATISDRFESVQRGGVYLYRKPLRRRSFPVSDGTRPATFVRGIPAPAGALDPLRLPATTHRAGTARTVQRPAAAARPDVAPRAGASDLADAAYAALGQGRPGEALKLAARALEVDPRNADALLVRAYAHADAGDFSAAIEEANAALAIDPQQASACYVLGIIGQQQGDLDEALRQFGRTLAIEPEFVLAHFNSANIHRSRGEYEEASRDYELTLRTLYVNPAGAWALFLGGFRNDLLAKTCELSLIECRRGT